MPNSNMQRSHHGNGGSSEDSHGAENVYVWACACALVQKCSIAESVPLKNWVFYTMDTLRKGIQVELCNISKKKTLSGLSI